MCLNHSGGFEEDAVRGGANIADVREEKVTSIDFNIETKAGLRSWSGSTGYNCVPPDSLSEGMGSLTYITGYLLAVSVPLNDIAE